MVQKDYFKRVLEQLVDAIAKIQKLKEAGEIEEAQQLIRLSFHRLTGLGFDAIEKMSDKDILSLFSINGFNAAKCLSIALLLREEADVCFAKGEFDRSDDIYEKSLNLFLAVHSTDSEFNTEETLREIDDIILKMDNAKITVDAKEKLQKLING
jgi:tetratricopeptide (TPR) repeat protein